MPTPFQPVLRAAIATSPPPPPHPPPHPPTWRLQADGKALAQLVAAVAQLVGALPRSTQLRIRRLRHAGQVVHHAVHGLYHPGAGVLSEHLQFKESMSGCGSRG